MGRLANVFAVLVLLVLVGGASPAHAEYVKDGALICDIADRYSGPALAMGADATTIIAWADDRNGNLDIFVQKVDSAGRALWAAEGVAVCTAAAEQDYIKMVSDGAGGAYLVWLDRRSGIWDACAQRIDADGNSLWAPDGIPLSGVSSEKSGYQIVAGDSGGVIIAWSDGRAGSSNYDIYAQAFDGDGNEIWTTDGLPICTATGSQWNPAVIQDGISGAIIAWEDNRAPTGDIYIQRVDSAGAALWADDGVVVCAASNNQWVPRLATDGNFGAYVTWIDLRNGIDYDVYAQHIDQYGYAGWLEDGAEVATEDYHEVAIDIISDGAGGAILLFGDQREVAPGLYAQRLEPYNGNPMWHWSGVPICTIPNASENPVSIPDGSGGAIFAWQDWRTGQTDIYAQRIDANGEVLWTLNGVAMCRAPYGQEGVCLIGDGQGGGIMGWRDARSGSTFDTYAQRISGDGLWGNPEPVIVSGHDAPVDQGGYVRIAMEASSHDIKAERDYPITGYNVWRRIHSSGGIVLDAAEDALVSIVAVDLLHRATKTAGVRISRTQAAVLGFPEGDWVSLGFHAAKQDTVYYLAAPTENDSTESGTPWETYVVTAHTPFAGVYVVSNADSAYSVDNLAPGLTPGFAGEQIVSPAALRFTWNRNEAPDLWHYRVHRGDDGTFVPDPSNLIGTTTDLTLLDPEWAKPLRYFYKLVAVDRHGNRSASALLRPEDIKVGTMLHSFAASYTDGAIEVAWRLSEVGADTRFIVSKAQGVGGGYAEIPDAAIEREALSYTFRDALVEPGTEYRYRVEACEGSNRKVLFETEKISTPPMPLALHQNHPNPFNPSTTIRYYLPEKTHVVLEVFDSSGRRIVCLVNEIESAGSHVSFWNGRDDRDRAVSAGVYFYRLTAGKETISRKMVLLR